MNIVLEHLKILQQEAVSWFCPNCRKRELNSSIVEVDSETASPDKGFSMDNKKFVIYFEIYLKEI